MEQHPAPTARALRPQDLVLIHVRLMHWICYSSFSIATTLKLPSAAVDSVPTRGTLVEADHARALRSASLKPGVRSPPLYAHWLAFAQSPTTSQSQRILGVYSHLEQSRSGSASTRSSAMLRVFLASKGRSPLKDRVRVGVRRHIAPAATCPCEYFTRRRAFFLIGTHLAASDGLDCHDHRSTDPAG